MCRMIAAVGDFELGPLLAALRRMASNENPAHTHEKRPLGAEFRHLDGWGVAWVEDDRLNRVRSERSCLDDPRVDELAHIRTSLAILHARRASRPESVSVENTHPFLAEWGGRTWAFCHNGTINDLSVLRPPGDLDPLGDMDSERLFHHVLGAYDPENPARSILKCLEPIRDYTSLHSFLATSDAIHVIAKRHMDQGELAYHALWEGRGPGIRVASSEPVDWIRCRNWARISEPDVRIFRRPG